MNQISLPKNIARILQEQEAELRAMLADPEAAKRREEEFAALEKAELKRRWRTSIAQTLEGMGVRSDTAKAIERYEGDPAVVARYGGRMAMAGAMSWVSSDKRFLVLSGEYRIGKTCASAWAMLKLLERKTGGKLDGNDRFRNWGWRTTAGELADVSRRFECYDEWRQMFSIPLLVVDDLGTEPVDERWGSAIGTLIDARHDGERRTIITMNLGFDEFRERYGPRILARINESVVPVVCDSPDLEAAGA